MRTREQVYWIEAGFIKKNDRISTDIIKSFCSVLKEGGTVERACNITGVTLEDVHNWIKSGKKQSNPQHPHRIFYLNYYESKIFAEANHVGEEQRQTWINRGYVPPDFPLSSSKINKIKSYIIVGVTPDTAMKKEGINPKEAEEWMQESYTKRLPFDHPYRLLSEAIASAEAEAELRYVTMVHKQSADGKSGAAQWVLERRFPEKWTKTDKKDLNLKGGIQINVTLDGEEKVKRENVAGDDDLTHDV